jgi:signal transduction histidine kinase/ligand-binding sensor domain-containing protein
MPGRGLSRVRLAVLTAVLLCACGLASAIPGIVDVRFRNYSTGDGLSQATAMAMAQDGAGFLWVGTQDGLNRFDGYGFKVYKHVRSQPGTLSDNAITALAADKDGSLWIGTQAGGLDHYDPLLDRFEHYASDPMRSDSIASENITALMIDRRDWLWIAGTGGRLQWLDRVTHHFLDAPLGDQAMLSNVRVLRQARDGSVLIGSRDGLWQCDVNAGNLHELRFGSAKSLDVRALAIGPTGDIWVATTGSGIYRFTESGKAVAWYHAGAGDAHALPGDEIRSLQFDRQRRLWVATKAKGLLRIDPDGERIEQFRHDPANPRSLAADRQESVLIDRDGLVWAGSWNDGISVHDPRTEAFVSLRSVPGDPNTLPSNPVVAALANPDGTLWLGFPSGGGMARFDPQHGVVQRFVADENKPDALPVALIEQIARSRDGSLWIPTSGGGLVRLPPGSSQFVRYRHDPNDPASLASDDLLYAMQDRQGTLWVGTTDAGLDELCEGCKGFRHHQHESANPDSIGFGPVASVLEDGHGALWVALRPGGLDRYDRGSGRFEHFRPDLHDPQSLSNDAITTFLQDSQGEIWVGTQGGGINHLLPETYANPRFEKISSAEGLAADAIGSIVEDARHDLWISTTAGISRYDPASRHIVNFGPTAGTLTQGYYINVAAKLADGRILFGGLSGATLFQPGKVDLPPVPVPILTEVLLNNQPAKLNWQDAKSPLKTAPWIGGTVTFGYRQRNIGFEFSAFGFADPQSVQYSYLLEGHDEQWIDTDASRRFATYTDLPAGDYLLRVRARRAGFPWNTRQAQMSVRVQPAPWVSPLAILGYCAALVLVFGIGGWRTRENWKRQERAREAIRVSAERLKYALWGSGGELWDVDLRTGAFVRENRLPDLKVSQMLRDETAASYEPFVHAEDLPTFRRDLVAHLKGETSFLESTYRTPDMNDQWRWMLTRGRVVERDARGLALRMVGTTQDITTLKEAEESLRKLNEELESRVDSRTADFRRANIELRQTLEQLTQTQRQLLESEKMAALGGLVAGVAHEINTPLGVTVTAASHLREEAMRLARQPMLDPEDLIGFHAMIGESSEIILRNLQRADRLIKSFKLVAVDQTTEERRRIELGAYLNDILVSLGPSLKKTPHVVAIECQEPVWLDTYPGALYQIVSNLVMNSLHHAFAPEQAGTITVTARQNENVVELTYRDNGVGMSDAVRARVFEPFFTTRRGQGGSGLGLHVVYNLVTQLLKGSIRVDSAPGVGAVFEIFLPCNSG